MSRKLWAPLGVLALVTSCLGFGLASSAANADGSGVQVTIHTDCLHNGTWGVGWFVINLKNQPGTLSGTNTYIDGPYDSAGNPSAENIYNDYTNVNNATLAFSGDQPATMTWADGSTEQVTFPVAQRPVGCAPVATKVRPRAVTFRDKHGMKHDVYIIPTTKGVAYTVHGKVVKAGSHHARGIVTVKAVARHGYALIGKTVWSHRFSRR